ncbi:hypothetical protein NVP1087A_28 [Vibrio phage 1.087.A._10N.261.45.F9]|nr:hypothetical protein NVP1087A_28 [Vibrio phage 1.087.A._10N.261.45.F9]
MLVYFFSATCPKKTIDGSMERRTRIESNDEYNQVINDLKTEISTQAGCEKNQVVIKSFNLL